MRRRAMRFGGFVFLFVTAVWPGLSLAQDWIYTVRPGDTLWDLSERHLLNVSYWPRLQEYNDISDPWLMPPGLRLRIPIRWLKVQPVPARVLAATEGGTVTRAGSSSTSSLVEGTLLHVGDSVEVSPTGSATLVFADGSRLLIAPGSVVRMDALRAYGNGGMVDTRVRLEEGRTETQVPPEKYPASRFEIWTPAAVSAVRGTNLRVGVAEEGEISRTEVLAGMAEVSAGNRSVRVREGLGTITKKGRPPSAPRTLLPAPDLTALPPKFDRVPIRFRIDPVANAKAYRIEIATTSAFETLLFDSIGENTTIRGPDLPDGRYVMRVRAIDDQGLEGLNASADIVVDARPEPPLLMEPIKEGKVREEIPAFRWAMPVNAVSFRFQLAKSNDFTAPLVDLDAQTSTSLRLEQPIVPGDYSWRVATTDASGKTGPFSDPQSFELKPAPASPELEPPERAEDSMVFRWRAGQPDQTYQVQFARDPAFEDILSDEQVGEPQVIIERPEPGQYFLRVRTIDDDGYKGPFSTAQSVYISPEEWWPLLIIPFLIFLPLLL
jgi:hypothetical protein